MVALISPLNSLEASPKASFIIVEMWPTYLLNRTVVPEVLPISFLSQTLPAFCLHFNISVMETLDSAELLMEDQAWLNYLWDFKTRGIDLDFSSTVRIANSKLELSQLLFY